MGGIANCETSGSDLFGPLQKKLLDEVKIVR